jgi:hypothetical protein
VLQWAEFKAELEKHIGGDFTKRIMASVTAQLGGLEHPTRSVDSSAFAQAFRTAALGFIVPAIRKLFTQEDVYESIRAGNYPCELVQDDRCEAKPLVIACKKIARQFIPQQGNSEA